MLKKEEISKYYLVTKINKDWDQEQKWQYKKLERAGNSDAFVWTIELKETKEVIGQISCQEGPKEDHPEIRDLGWFLDTPYQKKGYAFEAALEVCKYMFLEVEIKSIETCVALKNPSSWRLLEKLGFTSPGTTHFISYTFLEDKEEVKDWQLTKKEFLKEYFRKQELYITEDIDKDPFIMHLTDDRILNLTGLKGCGKESALIPYQEDPECVIIDLEECSEEDFDTLYQNVLDKYQNSEKQLIIHSTKYYQMKDVSLLKGDIIILRTCVNTCYGRCMEEINQKGATFEELVEDSVECNHLFTDYHQMNNFLDKVEKRKNESI